jgi:hypothetical protein
MGVTMKIKLMALMISLFISIPCSAGIYKWVDEKGVTHYSNEPPAHLVNVESRKEIKRKSKPRESKENGVITVKTTNAKLHSVRSKAEVLGKPGDVNQDKVAFYERYIKITKERLKRYQRELAEIECETYGNHQDYFTRLEAKKKQVHTEKIRLRGYTKLCERAKKGL